MQKTERMIKSKLEKKVRTFKDMKNDRQEIEKLMKELNENSRMRTKRSQKTAKTRYLKKVKRAQFNLNKDRHGPQVISGLLNKSGKLIMDTTTMCKMASEYHEDLQKPPKRERNNTQKINDFLEIITQTIGNRETQMLEKDTNEIEVAKAIDNSKNSTVPRIDGISYKFYKF